LWRDSRHNRTRKLIQASEQIEFFGHGLSSSLAID
jgi:hypothetical protein